MTSFHVLKPCITGQSLFAILEPVCLSVPTNHDTKIKLAEIYEISGKTRKTLNWCINSYRHPRPSTTKYATTISLFAEDKSLNGSKAKSGGGRRETDVEAVQLKVLDAEKEREVVRGWRTCCEVWEGTLRDGDGDGQGEKSDERPLVETKADEDRMTDQLRLILKPTKYQVGRPFMQYRFIPMKRGQYHVAEEILQHIVISNAYQPQDRQSAIRIALTKHAVFSLNGLMSLSNKPANLSHNINSTTSLVESSSAASQGGDAGKKTEDGDEEDETPEPTAGRCGIVVAAKSYQSAIFYLLHIYDYPHRPHDLPLSRYQLNMECDAAPIQQQYHLIFQAMAFMTKDRKPT
ncbi:hypothetical protein BJ165DRAFT_1409751 [Panaeolus papilionaceus]|nr:hypothetical protein BJ165DRAFT_1409751 [Panaeolus papilionaceus]